MAYVPGQQGDATTRLAEVLGEGRGFSGTHGSSAPPGEPHLVDIFKAHLEALAHYTPQPYDGPLLLLRSRGERDEWHRDPSLGWAALSTKPINTQAVPGDHFTMLEPPHVTLLAAQLEVAIARARGDADAGIEG
jgi:hypothetical protein